LISIAASKAGFAGTPLLIRLMRENRQASRVLTLGVSCGVSWLELQRQKYGSRAPCFWSDSSVKVDKRQDFVAWSFVWRFLVRAVASKERVTAEIHQHTITKSDTPHIRNS